MSTPELVPVPWLATEVAAASSPANAADVEPFLAPRELLADLRQWADLKRRALELPSLTALGAALEQLEYIRSHPHFADAPAGFRAFILNESCAAHFSCYTLAGNVQHLEKAASCGEETVQVAPPGPLRLMAMNNLASVLRAQYRRNGEPATLRRGIKLLENAVAETEVDSPDLPARLNNLGNALGTYWEHSGASEDLQRGVSLLQEAVFLTKVHDRDLPVRLGNLSRILLVRYQAFGDGHDLRRAIENAEQALRLSWPEDPDRPLLLAGLGLALLNRYDQGFALPDLQRTIALHEEAIRLAHEGAPEKSMYFNDLGVAQLLLYGRSGDFSDLERALELYETSVRLTAPDAPELAMRQHNLAAGLRHHYLYTGELVVLERMIAVAEAAVANTPAESPERPPRLSALADALCERHNRTSDRSDLERASLLYEEAVDSTPPGNLSRGHILNGAGTLLLGVAQSRMSPDTLEQAIRRLEEALQSASLEVRPIILNNLGTAYFTRFALFDDVEGLQQAIDAGEEAVSLATSFVPDEAMYRRNLAATLLGSYRATGNGDHLERAATLCREALEMVPPDAPSRPGYLGLLGRALLQLHLHGGSSDALDEAITMCEKALALRRRLFVASPLIYHLGAEVTLLEVYTSAALVFVQAAATRPAEAEEWMLKAVAAVEASKSRLLTSLVARKTIPPPPSVPRDLVAREQTVIEQLTRLDIQALTRRDLLATQETEALAGPGEGPRTTIRSSLPNPAQVLDPHEQVHRWNAELEALQEVWQEMERYAGVQDYLSLRRGADLSPEAIGRLARALGPDTALLSLAVTEEQVLLFAVCAAWPTAKMWSIPMDHRTWRLLLSRLFREVHHFDGTGRRGETWFRALKPLLAEAGEALVDISHVVLIPHLVGHLLPWSALTVGAGWEATVSVTPAAGLLERILNSPPVSGNSEQALVVGNPSGDLFFAGSEAVEVANLLGTWPLIGPAARKEAVLQRLARGDVTVAHFATHAYFAPGSPLDSGLVLADGVLTAREIMERDLQMPPFVVLSACETGLAGLLGGDELAGLSQALFATGARSQLLSLWQVNDRAAAELVSHFYRLWLSGRANKSSALRAAMEHIRKAEPAWAYSYYWGAFNLFGAWQ